MPRNRFRNASQGAGGRINPTVPLVTDGGSHPNLPIKPGLPGVNPVGDVPPIIDTFDIPAPQSDLTRRSIINRVSEPVPTQLSATATGRLERIAWLVGEFRTKAKYLKHWYQSNLGWIMTFGVGMAINEPTKLVMDGREYTPVASADTGKWTVNLDGSGNDIQIYDGTQDYVDSYLGQLTATDYTDTHEGFSYLVVRLQNLPSWPEIFIVGEGDPDIRIDGATDTRGYTDNPAWILGKLIEAGTNSDVDWLSLETCADYCDEILTSGGKRSQIGMDFHRPEYVEDLIAVLEEYAYCYVINNGSQARFVSDQPRTPVMSLDNNNIDIGQTQWTKGDLDTTPGNVVVEWENSQTGQRDEAYAIDAALEPEDVYYMKGFLSQAQAAAWAVRRYNKMTLRDLSGAVAMNAEAICLDFGDVVTVSDRRYRAIQSKLCEVLEIQTGQPGRYELKVIEYQENVYSDTAQMTPESPDTPLVDVFDYPTSQQFFLANTDKSVTFTSSGDAILNSEISWVEPKTLGFPYVTGYHVIFGFGDSATNDGIVLFEAILPKDTTETQFRDILPNFPTGYGPYDAYVTILTSARPAKVVSFTNDGFPYAELGGLKDENEGIYHTGVGAPTDPTPDAPTNVQANEIANNVAGVAGVWVAWDYDNRPNYVRRFRVRIYNITTASYELTTTTSSRNTLVSSSGWNNASDSYRAEVEAENRTGQYSTVAQSAAFSVSTVL